MKLAGKGKVFDGKDFIADVTYSVSMRKASQFAPADGQIHLEPDIGVYADRLTLESYTLSCGSRGAGQIHCHHVRQCLGVPS